MNIQQLKRRRDYLKRQNEQLVRELIELDHLMRLAGFSGGLETVKLTAEELIEYEVEDDDEEENKAA